MKFWSKEWTEAIKEKSLADKDYLRKTKGWSIRFYWVVTDTPDGIDRSWECHTEDGKLVFTNFEEKPAPSDLATRPWDGTKYFVRAKHPIVFG